MITEMSADWQAWMVHIRECRSCNEALRSSDRCDHGTALFMNANLSDPPKFKAFKFSEEMERKLVEFAKSQGL